MIAAPPTMGAWKRENQMGQDLVGSDQTISSLQEGTDITGTTMPAGGSSARGWLSAICQALWNVVSHLPLTNGRLDTNVSGSVAVSNLPATQPVSGSVSVSNLPVTQAVSGTVSVGNFPATQAVTGTFYQATQPVSGSVSVSNLPGTQAVSGTVTANMGTTNGLALDATLTGGAQKATVRSAAKGSTVTADVTSTGVDANTQALDVAVKGTVPVSGTFYQATQPVSGTVAVNNLPSTQPVTGTFWQATQPVSGPLTDTQLRATAVPVSGTFFQATQPVSGTVAVSNLPATQPVSGTVSVGNFPASQAVTGTFWQATQPVSQATLTKGTQGATGVSTQDLKDAGRSAVLAYAQAVAGAISETIISTFAVSRAYGAPSASSVTSLPNTTVTAGKTLRIQQIIVSFIATTTTANSTQIGIRVNTGGAAVIGSSLVLLFPRIAWETATFIANQGETVTLEIPDGLEIPAGAGIGITHKELAANGTIDVSIIGYEY